MSVISGTISALNQRKSAKESTKIQEMVALDELQKSERLWDRWRDRYDPIEEKLTAEVSAPVEEQPGFGRMMGQIDRTYGDLSGNLRRTLAGRYPSGSGLETEPSRTLALQRGLSKAGAVSDAETARFGKMLSLANLGRGLLGQSFSGSASAGQTFGNMANMYNQAAGQSWNAVGNALGTAAQLYDTYKSGKAAAPAASTWVNSGNAAEAAGAMEGAAAEAAAEEGASWWFW